MRRAPMTSLIPLLFLLLIVPQNAIGQTPESSSTDNANDLETSTLEFYPLPLDYNVFPNSDYELPEELESVALSKTGVITVDLTPQMLPLNLSFVFDVANLTSSSFMGSVIRLPTGVCRETSVDARFIINSGGQDEIWKWTFTIWDLGKRPGIKFLFRDSEGITLRPQRHWKYNETHLLTFMSFRVDSLHPQCLIALTLPIEYTLVLQSIDDPVHTAQTKAGNKKQAHTNNTLSTDKESNESQGTNVWIIIGIVAIIIIVALVISIILYCTIWKRKEKKGTHSTHESTLAPTARTGVVSLSAPASTEIQSKVGR